MLTRVLPHRGCQEALGVEVGVLNGEPRKGDDALVNCALCVADGRCLAVDVLGNFGQVLVQQYTLDTWVRGE